MSTGPREMKSMSSFNPKEPAILHDRIADNIETWTGEDEADYRKNSVTLRMERSRGETSCSMDGAMSWAADRLPIGFVVGLPHGAAWKPRQTSFPTGCGQELCTSGGVESSSFN
jgi:hypothetical protein